MDREIIDYKVVRSRLLKGFQEEVVSLLAEGFCLHGPMINDEEAFSREMVKYKPIEPIEWMSSETEPFGGKSTQNKFDGWVEIDPVTRKPIDNV